MRRTEWSSFIETKLRKWRTMKDWWRIIYWRWLSSTVKSETKEINMFPMKIERAGEWTVGNSWALKDRRCFVWSASATHNNNTQRARAHSNHPMCVCAGRSVCVCEHRLFLAIVAVSSFGFCCRRGMRSAADVVVLCPSTRIDCTQMGVVSMNAISGNSFVHFERFECLQRWVFHRASLLG